jgi:hypothetical protein
MQRDRRLKLCTQRPRKSCQSTTLLKSMLPHAVVLLISVGVVDLHKVYSILRTDLLFSSSQK